MIVVILASTVLGCAAVGWLRTGSYRRPGEGGPLPRHLWPAPVVPVVGGLLAHALSDRPWPVLLPYLVLVPVGLVLAAIDADVHRLPNAITVPLVPVELALLAVASAATGDWTSLRRAGLAAALVGGGALLLALLAQGRTLGMGDAKLLVPLAAALGWLSWWHVLAGLWLGLVLGGALALVLLLAGRVTRSSRLAFGPCLVAGTLLAVVGG